MTIAVAKRIKKDSRKHTYQAFCEWLVKETKGSNIIMSHAQCRKKFEEIMEKKLSTNEALLKQIYFAKLHCQEHFGLTFINHYLKGWRIATEKENTIIKMRMTKSAVGRAWSASNFKPKIDWDYLEFATSRVFKTSAHRIEEVASTKEAFYEDFKNKFFKQLREEAKNVKQIEAK